MPILVGSQSLAAPLALPDVGYCVATWYAPDGTVWPLMAPQTGVFTMAEGVSGLGAAAIEITVDERSRGGGRVRHVQPGSRTIVWPLYVQGDTHTEFIQTWRAVTKAFTQTTQLGPGQLEIARPDGSARRVDAYYQAGIDTSGKQGYGITSDFFVLSLLCEDPYWRDAQPQRLHREFSAGVDYLSPYPSVSSSQVLGATTLVNPGDVEAWPQWTMTGPASLLTATRQDTGDAFSLNPSATAIGHGNLTAGQYVTVDTDPPRVRYMDGTNWSGALNWPGAVLWSVPPGQTDVTFDLTGAAAGSAVDMTFYPRYETA
jgi:hypothetical protein